MLSATVQAGRGGADRHRGFGRADRGERLHEHRADFDLGQGSQVGSGKDVVQSQNQVNFN